MFTSLLHDIWSKIGNQFASSFHHFIKGKLMNSLMEIWFNSLRQYSILEVT